MTLAELIEKTRALDVALSPFEDLDDPLDAECDQTVAALSLADVVAGAVLNLLGNAPALSCGHTVAGARDADGPYVELDGDTMSPEDARGIAVALLRAADEAEGK